MSGLEVIAAIVLFLWAIWLSLSFLWMAKRHHEMTATVILYWPITAELMATIAKHLEEIKSVLGSRKDVH